MRSIDKAAVPVIVLAGGMVYLADYLRLPVLVPSAIGLFGLFAVWLGSDTFIRGEIRMFDRRYSKHESYSGNTARLLAVIIFLFGIGLVLFAGWEFLRPGEGGRFLADFVRTRQGLGIFCAVFGFFTLLFGFIRLIAGSAWNKDERTALDEFGSRLRGFIGIIVGVLLIGAGWWIAFR